MKKIWIYGGAFNPPTLGHTSVISQLLDTKIVDTIILVPDGERDDKSYGISQMHRKKLITLFYTSLVKKWYDVKLCMHFFNKKWFTLTYDVNSYFEQSFGENVYHIFWTDVASWMPLWTGNPENFIEKKLKKIFIPRKGYFFPTDIPLDTYQIVDIDTPDISSTLVRHTIQKKEDFQAFLSDDISTYIEKHHLYLD